MSADTITLEASQRMICGSVSGPVVESRLSAVFRRMERLSSVEPGWNDGHGDVPSPASWKWLNEGLRQLLTHQLSNGPEPHVFLNDDGGFHMEWRRPSRIALVDIDPEGKIAVLTAVDANRPEQSTEREYGLSGSWSTLFDAVHAHVC